MSDNKHDINGKRKSITEENRNDSRNSSKYDNDNIKKFKNDNEDQPSLKIQLKLGPSITPKINLSTSKESKKITIPAKTTLNKMTPGILAPSKKDDIVLVKKVSEKVASVFGDDSESEEEEMPLEAKMRMRNVGRKTPTSQGPNSYGKTNLGFCDTKKLFEKQLKEQADEILKQEEEKKNFKK